jgi:hypothetical protein
MDICHPFCPPGTGGLLNGSDETREAFCAEVIILQKGAKTMSHLKLVANNPDAKKKSLNPIVRVCLFPGFVPKPETIAERNRLVAEAKKRYASFKPTKNE